MTLSRWLIQVFVSTVIVVYAAYPSMAKNDRDTLEKLCNATIDNKSTSDQRISACTNLIGSESDNVLKARNLFFRGAEFMRKGLDGLASGNGIGYIAKAASDFSASLEANPLRDHMANAEFVTATKAKFYADGAKSLDGCLVQPDQDHEILSCNRIIEYTEGFFSNVILKALAYKQLGYVYLKRSEFNRAIMELDKSITLDDNNWATYGLRGGAYLEIAKYDLAISDLSKAAKINDRSDDVYVLMCVAHIYKGQYRAAISDCDAALGINPKSVDATNARREARARLAEGAGDRQKLPSGSLSGQEGNVFGRMLCNKMLGTSPWNIMSPCN
jgi:tetratricopeptide (TPR) repeat protein